MNFISFDAPYPAQHRCKGSHLFETQLLPTTYKFRRKMSQKQSYSPLQNDAIHRNIHGIAAETELQMQLIIKDKNISDGCDCE